ncbi:MAG: hypothetical protein WCD16_15990 [Paracoccaceae bacterium]
MTDRIAVFLFIVIVAALCADYWFNDWTASVFLGKKFADLTEYIAFWR